MLNPLGLLLFVCTLSLTNSRGFFMSNRNLSFYFNSLFISGWALARPATDKAKPARQVLNNLFFI
jgi:hypothetical protein